MGIQRWPMDSPHKKPVARKTFPRNDVFMYGENRQYYIETLPMITNYIYWMNYWCTIQYIRIRYISLYILSFLPHLDVDHFAYVIRCMEFDVAIGWITNFWQL